MLARQPGFSVGPAMTSTDGQEVGKHSQGSPNGQRAATVVVARHRAGTGHGLRETASASRASPWWLACSHRCSHRASVSAAIPTGTGIGFGELDVFSRWRGAPGPFLLGAHDAIFLEGAEITCRSAKPGSHARWQCQTALISHEHS